MKSTLKRFLSLVLCMFMVMALLPNVTMTAFAATSGTVTGLADENIGLSFTGDADDAWSANGTSITGAVTSTSAGCSDTVYKSTLTITNKKSTTATLSFDYTIEQNSGTIQVNGTAVSSGASFTKELAANESVKVYIQSGSTSAATKITLTNVVLVSDVNATATFVPAENGTYTVDGKLITEEYSNTQSSMTAYQVVATPADGYQFMGWYDVSNEKYISTSAKAALNIDSDCTITARFASKTAALFETGGQPFDNLGDAVTYAQANGQSKITLAADGSISGSYTIPAGITLLIPFDAAGTLYTDAPAAIRTTPESKPFRTLTMSEGTSITVNGAISLGGRYFAAGGGQQGRPIGDYGYIKMADNSSITVKNGGKLYAWGFISGSGSVLAESGATVYEFYQIADFRGGSASSGMGHGVFPFSQYFVQNIEVPLTLNAGANEQVYSGVYAMSKTFTTAINFIGDTGMFKVESGSFTKDYDEKADRLVFTVNGEAALNTLSLKLAGMSVNSASYVLPITNNITINIQSGNVTINQDTALLAGVEVNIAEGAGLTVANGKNIYFYDSDEWNSDNFVWGPCKFKSVAYAPGKAYNRSNNDLVDAKMDVNGSVTAIGAIYTTEGGANICSSSGTGKYIQQGTPGTATATYQYNASSNAVTIPITAAKLHNADGSYADTKGKNSGTTFYYSNGVWGTAKPCDHKNTEIRNAKDATCTKDGNKEYWTCEHCKKYFLSDDTNPETAKAVELSETVIPASHKLTKVEAKDATCTEDGNKAYWTCEHCGKYFLSDDTNPETAKAVELSETVISASHKLTKVEAKAATYAENGNKAYWTCEHCKKYFLSDDTNPETATAVELSETVIPALVQVATTTTPIKCVYGQDMNKIDLRDYVKNTDVVGEVAVKVATGSTLPDGMKLDNGKISGKPAKAYEDGKEVTFTFTAENGNTANLTLLFLVAKADPTVEVAVSGDSHTEGDLVGELELILSENSTKGVVEIVSEIKALVAGKNTLTWKFTPEDENNYNMVTGTVVVNAKATTTTTTTTTKATTTTTKATTTTKPNKTTTTKATTTTAKATTKPSKTTTTKVTTTTKPSKTTTTKVTTTTKPSKTTTTKATTTTKPNKTTTTKVTTTTKPSKTTTTKVTTTTKPSKTTTTKATTTTKPSKTTTTNATTTNTAIPSYGDVNLDGKVDILDAVFLNKYLATLVQFSDVQIANADCYQDGVLNAQDTTALMQFIILLIDNLPV